MAEDNDKWKKQKKAFDAAIADFDKAIELNPEDAMAYYNRGTAYAGLEQFDAAIADFDKAIELNPDFVEAYHNRALSVGKREAEKATKTIKDQLQSFIKPKKIVKRFKKRQKVAKLRLKWLRWGVLGLYITIIITIPLTWMNMAGFISVKEIICDFNGGFCVPASATEHTDLWPAPLSYFSATLATLFLHFPILLRIAQLNKNARIERHAYEDYDRKIAILMLRVDEGPNEQIVLEHFSKTGTPEVLNRLYYPKQTGRAQSDSHSEKSENHNLLEKIYHLLKEWPKSWPSETS